MEKYKIFSNPLEQATDLDFTGILDQIRKWSQPMKQLQQ